MALQTAQKKTQRGSEFNSSTISHQLKIWRSVDEEGKRRAYCNLLSGKEVEENIMIPSVLSSLGYHSPIVLPALSMML